MYEMLPSTNFKIKARAIIREMHQIAIVSEDYYYPIAVVLTNWTILLRAV